MNDISAIDSPNIQAVKTALGPEAVDRAIRFEEVLSGVVSVTFQEGVINAQLEGGSVEIILPKWAQELGWRMTDDE